MKKLCLVALLLSVTGFVGCGGGSSSSGGNTPPPVTLQSIQVTPATPSINTKATQQFKATGSYSDGSTKDLTTTANWLSSSTSVASITTSGLATALAVGTTTISATSGSVAGTTTLTVVNPLVSIAVTPATASVSPIAPNNTQQYTATGTFTDGSTQTITSAVTWSASTGATITAGGLATAVTANASVTIMATQGSISGTAILTVTNPLVSIAITPPSPSVAASFTEQLTATGTYADNSTQVLTASVTWASDDSSIATISNIQGSQGLATGVAAGMAHITATDTASGKIGTATLTVTNATLVSIDVTPKLQQLIYQSPQQQYTATGTFSDTSTHDITGTVTWTSSDTTHITITPTGLATGVATTSSPVTITATDPKTSKFGNTTATVISPPVTAIDITPDNTNLAVGTSRHYTATATLQNGSTLNVTNLATWTTSNPGAATLLSKGLVKGTATGGTTVITATYNGASANFTLSVNNVTVNSITVTPIAATMPVGVTQVFTATAVFSDTTTQDITMDATWASDTSSVATINSLGVASSLTVGSAKITATFGGKTSLPAVLTVDSSTLTTIAITPGSTVLPVGKTIFYNAYGTYGDGITFVLTGLVTWTSSAQALVSIVPGGVATTLKPGPAATITAAYQKQTGTATVIVTQFPLTSIAVTPATGATVPVGVSTPFTAQGTFADKSTQNLTSYATWAANPPSVATISNATTQWGQATGLTAGSAAVTAVFAGIASNSAPLTVSTATIQSLAVTPNPASATSGSQLQFKAVGTFLDPVTMKTSTIDLTTQVVWTCSNPTVASINNSGTASVAGAANSTANIVASFTQNGVTVQGTSVLTVH